MTSASYAIESVKQQTSYKPGLQAGIGLKVEFDTRLFFAPAIYYSMKGYKASFKGISFPPDSAALDNNTSFHSVETAFLLQYDFSDKPGHFFIKGGPSLDFQLFGREKFNTPSGPVKRATPFGYDKYGHYLANLILQLGYELKNDFFIYGHYSQGVTDVNNADAGPRIRHRAIGISFGKFLRSKKIVVNTSNKE